MKNVTHWGGAADDLLERDRETSALARAIEAAQSGSGSLVVFEASPGLGKTMLLQAAAGMCRDAGLRVVSARCSELEREFPFGVVRQIFEPLLAVDGQALLSGAAVRCAPLFDLAGDGSQSLGMLGLLHGLYWLAVNLCAEGPAALIVDDAHWSDTPSLEFLGFLLRRIGTVPIAMIVATRPLIADGADRALAALVSDPAAAVAEPRPLSRDAVTRLVRRTFGETAEEPFCQACHDVTQGNPLFVRELLRALAADGTPAVAAAAPAARSAGAGAVARYVAARVSHLAPDLRQFAEAVAVLGDEADLAGAARLAGLAEVDGLRAADSLTRLGMLSTADPPSFAHPLVREALYQGMPAARRNESHDRAAAQLAQEGAAAERVASHVLHTTPRGEPRRIEILLRAARAARDRGVPEGAAVYLARARAEPPEANLRSEISRQLGNCEAYCLQFDEASEHLREAVDLAETSVQRGLSSFSLARFRNAYGDPAGAISILSAAASELPDGEHPVLSIRLAAELVGFGRVPVSDRSAHLAQLAEFERGLVRGRELWPPYPDVLAAQQAAEEAGRPGGQAAAARLLADRALAGALLPPDQSAFYTAALTLLICGDLDSADRYLEAGLSWATSRGLALTIAALRGAAARSSFLRGDLAEVQAHVAAGLEAAAGSHFALPVLQAVQIEAMLDAGDAAGAEVALTASGFAGQAEIPDSSFCLGLLYARARVKLHRTEYADALADYRECGRRYLSWAPVLLEFPWRSGAAQALLALGQPGEASHLVAEELELARSFGAPRQLGAALTSMAALVAADQAASALLADEAVAVLNESPARLDLARAFEVSGDCLLAAGQRAKARLAYRGALQLALECHATAAADRLRQRLTAGGGRPPRLWLTGVHALTPTERQVARLAAAELTNREIAEKLFVTEKTVETHLRSVYRKLDITARWQLATKLADDRTLSRGQLCGAHAATIGCPSASGPPTVPLGHRQDRVSRIAPRRAAGRHAFPRPPAVQGRGGILTRSPLRLTHLRPQPAIYNAIAACESAGRRQRGQALFQPGYLRLGGGQPVAAAGHHCLGCPFHE
jgi:DNA-binding CsgD family transcriptional regulator